MAPSKKLLITIDFVSYRETVFAALDGIGAGEILAGQSAVLIKPNLINSSPHPVTTPVDCCEAIVEYIRSCSTAQIVIGEGCGEPSLETQEVFDQLGYTALAKRMGVALIDLNDAPLTRLINKTGKTFPDIFLPEIAL